MERDEMNTSQNTRKRTASEVGPPDTTSAKVIKSSLQSDVHNIFCTICMKTITDETIGKPDACDHEFCLACILQWSKTKNSCPIDREPFHKIYFTNPSQGRYEGHVTVADIPDFEEEEDDEEDEPIVADFEEEEDDEEDEPIVADQMCRVCTYSLNDLGIVCSRCLQKGVHHACTGVTLHGASENWNCDECVIFCRMIDVFDEVGFARDYGEPGPEVDLSPDEIECAQLYSDAVHQYRRASAVRWSLQLDLATAALKVKCLECREETLACQETGLENCCNKDKAVLAFADGMLGFVEKSTDERLAKLEGDDDALDEYISIAQKCLEYVDNAGKSFSTVTAKWEKLDDDWKSSLEEQLLERYDDELDEE